MRFDHRRILATAIGRVRAKIKYRPVVFELMPDEFTLFELQKTVEAILGPHLHKQNFRRLVEGAGLVEPTGEVKMRTGGRPAKLYRFRREVLLERPAPGVRVKPGKADRQIGGSAASAIAELAALRTLPVDFRLVTRDRLPYRDMGSWNAQTEHYMRTMPAAAPARSDGPEMLN